MTADPDAGPGHRSRLAGPAVLLVLTGVVVAFSAAWPGRLVLDGPGASLYLRLALDHLGRGARGAWFPEMWAGSPVFGVMPSFPVLAQLPLVRLLGPDAAVKVAILAFQVVGGWGAYLLARSLWRETAPAIVAGIVFALHPMFLGHGVLAGAATTAGFLACLPWTAWSLRRALRGDGTAFVVLAGLLVAVAVLHQPDCAYALALVCNGQLAVQLGHVRGGLSTSTARQVLGRAAAVVGIGLGAVAHWLVPYVVLGKWFVTTRRVAPGDLLAAAGQYVQGDLGGFVHRSAALTASVGLTPQTLSSRLLSLGIVPLVLTVVAIFLLPGHDTEGTPTAVLTGAAVALWATTTNVPLAHAGMTLRGHLLAVVALGALTGILFGAYLHRLRLGSVFPWAFGIILAVMVAMPYVTPFLTLQRLLPAFFDFSAPRFYLVAPLALALGAAFPVAVLQRRLAGGRPWLRRLCVTLAVAAVTGAFVVDVWPARSFYRATPESVTAAGFPAGTVVGPGDGPRVALSAFDAAAVGGLVTGGRESVEGWPLATAGRQLARLTAEATLGPPGYRDLALGLAGAAGGAGAATVVPVVRAYEQAVVVTDDAVAAEVAVGLAGRNIGLVSGPVGAAAAAGVPVTAAAGATAACGHPSPAALAGDLAVACALHEWVPNLGAGMGRVGVDQRPGATLTAADGLRGVSVWLDGAPRTTDLVLYELGSDGLSMGREVARTKATGTDADGLATFPFDPIAGSAGRHYAFRLECPGCGPTSPAMVTVAGTGTGDLIVGSQLQGDRAAAFAPVYDRLPTAPPPVTTVRTRTTAPGVWRIDSSGPRPALVVVAEARFPGWRARVDGKAVPILGADAAFMGVAVPAGDHQVALDYRPPPAVWIGRVVTAGTVLVATLAVVVAAWRRRSATSPGRLRRRHG